MQPVEGQSVYMSGIWIGVRLSKFRPKYAKVAYNVDNTMLNYTNFAPGEPNYFLPDQNCVMFYPSSKTGIPAEYVGKWNDESCERSLGYGYICKKKASICIKSSCVDMQQDDEDISEE